MGCLSGTDSENLTSNLNYDEHGDEEQTCGNKCTQLINGARKALRARIFWKAVLLGQFISLLLCGLAVTSGLLSNQGVNIPTAQCFLNYLLLCVVFTPVLACRSGERNLCQRLKTWGWKYILIAIADVEANFLVVSAYQYTTVTSVQLLDCFSIPMVLLLSCLILRIRYKPLNFVGIVVCLLGMGGLILTDFLSGNANVKDAGKAPNKLLGDLLCIAGASLYGVSNVAEEYVVKFHDKADFLGMVGLFGSFVNGIQFVVTERDRVAEIDFSSYHILLPLIGFTVFQFLMYTCMTVVIQQTSATAVNISILSADFYTLLFGLYLFKYEFHILYFVSFVLILSGIAIYSCQSTESQGADITINRTIDGTPSRDSYEEMEESSVDD
ncbi:solute carrier family 35 member F1-like [Mizuhopecten yessoensis]|uniref:Solute carrier family 35 member F1 n=1 Tax=Mizuhopecten yessoensis TaxID=6573 RepID=A0A210Q8C8_MIZYE|nr:solute carrier family 35 member F1-like [Mizuhopecten yessoensis]XP_021364630.1 solute carrier family 35 member F1-like [Mizuhopecten yessoensis]XP_021364631.1 solute carrier family 35 member F1-like [Mizuhopecten yessoensis]OWF44997.1 Solute carrier family 35 member F1 [Mizuhopecten yessoensis]